jgi:hypothetical protein
MSAFGGEPLVTRSASRAYPGQAGSAPLGGRHQSAERTLCGADATSNCARRWQLMASQWAHRCIAKQTEYHNNCINLPTVDHISIQLLGTTRQPAMAVSDNNDVRYRTDINGWRAIDCRREAVTTAHGSIRGDNRTLRGICCWLGLLKCGRQQQ